MADYKTHDESPDLRERKLRDTALVEANYAVGFELSHGGLSLYSAAEYNERVIERARLFELYLDEGYDTARRAVRAQLDEASEDSE